MSYFLAPMDITEITVKAALVRSKITGVDYVINPYLGCAHGCRYCYAVFMRRYSRHHSAAAWGSFVEVKINLPDILEAELRRKKQPGRALLASVCDPYQPVEARYRLTRGCLKILQEYGWGADILTRSPLVTRDLDILKEMPEVSVGFSIPTDDDRVRTSWSPRRRPSPPASRPWPTSTPPVSTPGSSSPPCCRCTRNAFTKPWPPTSTISWWTA